MSALMKDGRPPPTTQLVQAAALPNVLATTVVALVAM
jgi:hypothetical protein